MKTYSGSRATSASGQGADQSLRHDLGAGKPRNQRHLQYSGLRWLRVGGLGDGEAQWHADMTYGVSPVHACALYAIEVPKTGGNTDFANMFAAYDALSTEIKERQ